MQHHAGGLTQQHPARAGFAIGQLQPILIELVPTKTEDLADTAAGEQDQPDGIHLIGPADGSLFEGLAEALQVVRVEDPSAWCSPVAGDAPAGIGPRVG